MDIVRDPVCGELIQWRKAAGVISFRERLYYFCCRHCLEKFQRSPQRFAE
ncbi:MAG: hypothetical protein FD174_4133 [Geobacteraceae bacterium]|nr:MAG: hypothetical protein FD174_4133 [Geobacteraceae bacterium]